MSWIPLGQIARREHLSILLTIVPRIRRDRLVDFDHIIYHVTIGNGVGTLFSCLLKDTLRCTILRKRAAFFPLQP